ncbi:NAD(P)H-dependent oxidoreductase [Photobacterium galatheae]|uniref:Nitroreductase n=1 Tax=Photobacterium galatheae TaxID=1654360 RepID=A0A066RLH9_9GAMM|nr:NAD(P)H-dependent oxidoreductase [Photobacterium galatheae]KDM91300.1 nitroreductase [Photobacterium galatheae]MCM0150299.1 NAD(P)H-dependent oxidoreductase [Photobacterium galatheae]
MNLIQDLNWRYAVRRFSDQKVQPELVEQLVESARLSASSFGLQPYRLLVIQSAAIREALLPHSMGQDKILNSSHLVVFAAQTASSETLVDRYAQRVSEARQIPLTDLSGMVDAFKSALASQSERERLAWAHQQANIALGQFLAAAAVLKVDACPMGGFDAKGYDDVLGLAEQGLTTSVICPIGYRHPDDASAHQPKVRVPTETFAQWVN